MTRLSARLAVLLTLVLLPLSAHAAAPGNVTGIQATLEGDKVVVTWKQPTGENITYYRVFYSHASILGNQGLYDDYDVSDGQDTRHELTNLPPSDELFVSVLAVNAKGEESPGFQSEAKVSMRAGVTPPAGTVTPPPSAEGGDKLRVLTATALTETGVMLTFSRSVNIPRDQAVQAFVIRDASGTILPLRRLIIEGPRVTLVTQPQVMNRVYKVTVGQVVTGTDDAGRTYPLDTQQGPTLFSGSVRGLTTVPPSSGGQTTPPPPPATPPQAGPSGGEIRNLRLNATRGEGNTYVVEVMWQPPATGEVAGYYLSQSLNGGRTYGPTQTVQKEATGIKIAGVPSAQFSVVIRTGYADGVVSQGVSQSLTLPGAGQIAPQPPVMQGTVTPSSKPTAGGSTSNPNLPSSGLGLPIVVALAGGLGGLTFMRRPKAA